LENIISIAKGLVSFIRCRVKDMPVTGILIIDNDTSHATKLKAQLTELGYNILDIIFNPREALAAYYASEPDLLIINTAIKNSFDGIEIAEKICGEETIPKPIIFTTLDKNPATFDRAKRIKPCAYLIKPFDIYLIKYAIELALYSTTLLPKITAEKKLDTGVFDKESLYIKKTKKVIRVPLKTILYIEVESKYSTIFTKLGKFLIRLSLNELMDILPQKNFLRVHRNYIVNREAISEFDFEEYTVHIENISLPIGRSFKNSITDNMVLLS